MSLPVVASADTGTVTRPPLRPADRLAGDRQTPRLLAFYLPQFHPIPENDEWWGRGFTEWANVVPARPRFPGHYQPRLPADLGFYDLRLAETRHAQAELARAHGIHGFVYYHYWFNGRRLLERPLDEVVRSGEPDFPFCVCWANENWSRNWNGDFSSMLMEQRYSDEDDLAHIRHLLPVLSDPRYVRVDGKPLLLVYRVTNLPDARRTADTWRTEAARHGLDLHLGLVESFSQSVDPGPLGFDSAVAFMPNTSLFGPRVGLADWQRPVRRVLTPRSAYRTNTVTRYGDLVENALGRPEAAYRRFPGVTPSWDNSARRRVGARILHGSTPELYGRWLEAELQREAARDEDGLVFVNAWNEWAEGAYLEPDLRWGRAYLEATARARASVVR